MRCTVCFISHRRGRGGCRGKGWYVDDGFRVHQRICICTKACRRLLSAAVAPAECFRLIGLSSSCVQWIKNCRREGRPGQRRQRSHATLSVHDEEAMVERHRFMRRDAVGSSRGEQRQPGRPDAETVPIDRVIRRIATESGAGERERDREIRVLGAVPSHCLAHSY